ncbi:MAG TPA: endonuclease/exonuclease/phosphatase family protein [Gemmatimonadales bacterium]|nr:endonuclease/exonuclease/phosphatase family protein [Gemmatimonadales bacterium]
MRRLLLPIATALLAVACNTSDNAGPTPLPAGDLAAGTNWETMIASAGEGAMPIRVYQQNVYPGFNIDNLVIGLIQTSGSGNPAYFVDSLAVAMATLDATDWRERAARMAQEIEAQNPDVVSLQEMVTIQRQGLQILGLPFADSRTDFLAIFTEELAKRGLPYKLVDSLPLTYAPIPISELFALPLPPGTIFATYYDRDALFVRKNVAVANVVADTFAVGLNEVVYQSRGFIAADLTLRGKTWRYIGTHPEPSWPAGSNPTQISELLDAANGTGLPVIIAGDLNLLPTSTWYAQLTGAGFIDLLQQQYGSTAAGYTCCQDDPALRNTSPTLVKRIDYVMARPAAGYGLGPFDIEVFGDEPTDRSATGMWPSDHAGLLAKLVLQKLHP